MSLDAKMSEIEGLVVVMMKEGDKYETILYTRDNRDVF